MDIQVRLIRQMNEIATKNGAWTSGGHFVATGATSDSLALAADYARWALESSRETDKRICDVTRCAEEIAVYRQAYGFDADLEAVNAVLNAKAYALSLICDRVRAFESEPTRNHKA